MAACRRTTVMATTEATTVDAGGRELRVSSPDRVIFPQTERTRRDHQARHRRVLPGGRGRHHARAATGGRPRSSAGRRASTRASCSRRARRAAATPSSRSASRKGAPGLRRDGADRVPLGPPRRRDLPDRDRGRRLVRPDGDDHLPPVAGAPRGRRPPRRAAHRPRPAAGHRLRRRRARRRRGARAARTSSATSASRRPRAAAASTSTCGSSRAGPSPTSATPRSPSAASSSGACPGEVTTKWWKEERGERIFVDYNQNARDRTIASAYSIRPKPGAPVSAPLTWDELADVAPEDFTVATMPARFAEVGDRHAAIDDVAHSLAAAARHVRARRGRGAATCRTRPTTRRCRASPSACSRRATATASATELRRLRQLLRPALDHRARRRRHDRADVAVGRLVEVDDHRRVVARPAALARLAVDPRRPRRARRPARRPARGRSASRGPGGTCRRGSPSR